MAAKNPDTTVSDTASQLRNAIVRTARVLRQDAAGESGLSPTQTAVLASINRCGPLTPSELAEVEHVKRPTMTRTLAPKAARFDCTPSSFSVNQCPSWPGLA